MTEGFLLGIASIAIALIGFSGVVIALGRRGEGKWTPSEMLQLRTLVEPSIVSLLGAFVPILLGLLFLNEESLWRTSNALLAVFHLVGFSAFIVRGSSSGVTSTHKIMVTIFILILLFLLASIFNYTPYHELAFGLSLLYGICTGVHNFYLLLFYPSEQVR